MRLGFWVQVQRFGSRFVGRVQGLGLMFRAHG